MRNVWLAIRVLEIFVARFLKRQKKQQQKLESNGDKESTCGFSYSHTGIEED
jgi:hypothetical protein